MIHQVAEENGLEMLDQLEAVQPGTSTLKDTASGERSQQHEDQLSKRFVELCFTDIMFHTCMYIT